MGKTGFDEETQLRPISAWGYVGYNLLYSLPLIGLIFLIVFAFSDKNINRRNYARSFFCILLLGIILSFIILVLLILLNVDFSSLYIIFNR